MAVAVGVAAPAYADSGADEDFISALDTAGITYDSPEQVIAAGKDVCELFGNGQTDTDIVTKVTEKNPGFTISGAARFAAIAMSAYCPERLAPSDDAEK
jgi:hypothetical protein